ncbi:RNA polymerase sigma-70 factor [uncultured Bacteroides sp.]|mgnify:CR=1 FL=1|jgi:RNA polymerase sigma-70 factor (ECF subfamily)|uniref:RNA polymerase sigma-70 factor n=1 Tax=uncultured Bacteroides sp. TaxID=162156 RepID=UPI0025D4CCC5|nr:RNA polymerase sigma-70 factor [uncultured Bacteroides sp.]
MDNLAYTIQTLKSGNQEAFEKLYRFYYKGLCAFSAQFVSFAEAEEIVQDTMLWLWENKDKINPELSLKSLLFTTVKNKSLNLLTHDDIKRRVHQEIIDAFEEEFEDPDTFLNREIMVAYHQAMSKVPAEFRQVFEMNRKQHLTHKEIALKLNISPQTVNYRIGQTLKQLRVELKDFLPLIMLLMQSK